ncbi:MAG: hypothetical protein IPO41_08885 [Acidobacteria bacterium]|nr:hypothetical protein [Acidobacteriota bacterium]
MRFRKVPTSGVNVAQVKEIPPDPSKTVWDAVSLHSSRMILQDLVEPRLLEPSTSEILVKLISNGSEIAFVSASGWTKAKTIFQGLNISLMNMPYSFLQRSIKMAAPQMGEVRGKRLRSHAGVPIGRRSLRTGR